MTQPRGLERVQFSNVPGARKFSLGKIQIRVSFGDLESKGISHPLRGCENPCSPTPTPEFRGELSETKLSEEWPMADPGTSRAPLHEEMYGEFLGEEYTGENHSVM